MRMDSGAERERQLIQAVESAQWRRDMLRAGGIAPDNLSERGQRILAWVTEWGQPTVDGVVELLGAAYRAGLAAAEREPMAHDHGRSRRDRDSITARLDAIQQRRPQDPEVGL